MSQAPVVYGKYQLLERLTHSGMAEVFKAKSHGVEGFEKVLVIKRILPGLSRDARFVETFIHEAKIAVTLSHANIVQVFDLGRVDDTYFIAMEYVAGLDLGSALRASRKAGRPLTEGLSVYVVSELAKALDYAHRRRDAEMQPLHVVHRDVSPENVLVSHEGEVKLSDFGVARARETVQRLDALPFAKLPYLAPEQARGEAVDARADIYALGAILYEALAGESVLGEGTSQQLLARARAGERQPLSKLEGTSAELLAILERALASDVEARYESAGDLYEDLIQYLYGVGRRIGAQDLSLVVEDLLRATASEPSLLDSNALSGLEDLFQDLETGSYAPPRSTTAVGIPTSRPPPSSLRPVDPAEWVVRAEWRDVCVLAASTDEPAQLVELALRYGAQPFPGEKPGEAGATLLLFGLGEAAGGRDAHEAARCALRAIRQAHDRSRLRVLLHQGRVLLDSEGGLLRDEVLSTLRSSALRGLASAGWGGVAASAATARTLRSRFELAPATDDAPRQVVRELRADEGVGRFVGRRAALRGVGEALALANRGESYVLAVRGEAGMGKTRLLSETARRLRHTGHEVGLYVATCAPRNRDVQFSGVAAMLRTILGVESLDTDVQIRQKLLRLRELGLSDAQTDAVARTLGLPVQSRGGFGSGTLRSALSRIAQKLAEDHLSVFVWDGSEFMDVTSVSVLMRTFAAMPRARVLAVLAYRPEEVTRNDLLGDAREIELEPLTESDIRRLVCAHLEVPEVPEELCREVALKSGGNPMYVEELVWALRDAGALSIGTSGVEYNPDAAGVELPRTLRGLIASRVGRLSASHRAILQAAVAIGAQFGVELLARTAGRDEATVRAALSLLEDRRIVCALEPGQYAFEHELTREVLYESLPLSARPELHAAVAAAIEWLRAQDLDPVAARLAYHHREAGNREEALAYLVRAAERAEAEHLPEAAIDAYAEAIELISTGRTPDRERVLVLQERIGQLALSTRRAEAIADRMGAAVELAESLGRDEFVARFAMMRGRLLNKASRFQEGRQWLERAQQVARRRGDRVLERDVALAAAEAHARNGEYKAVLQYAKAALPLARDTHDTPAQVRALLLAAPAHATIGDGERALAALHEVRTLVGNAPDRLTECELSRIRGIVLHQMGDGEGSIEAARHTVELAKEYGLSYEYCVAAHSLGEYYLRAGEDKRAFAALRSSYETATEHGFARQIWLNACVLGYLDAMRFESNQGRLRMVQAIRYAEQRGYVWDLMGEKYLLARVEQKRGDIEASRRALRSVMGLAERHGHQRLGDDAERALRALEEQREIPLPR